MLMSFVNASALPSGRFHSACLNLVKRERISFKAQIAAKYVRFFLFAGVQVHIHDLQEPPNRSIPDFCRSRANPQPMCSLSVHATCYTM